MGGVVIAPVPYNSRLFGILSRSQQDRATRVWKGGATKSLENGIADLLQERFESTSSEMRGNGPLFKAIRLGP